MTQVIDEAELTSNAEFERFEEKLQERRAADVPSATAGKEVRDTFEV